MKRETRVRVTVSGSFHRHMSAISGAVQELMDLGAQVLSPADPRVVDQTGEFLFVASDRVRSIRMVQDRHLEAIRAADLLWLVCPDGYVGQSASMEIGFAVANNVPVFASVMPSDLTLRKYVHVLPKIGMAVEHCSRQQRQATVDRFLLDPHSAVEEAQQTLARIAGVVSGLRPETAEREIRGLYGDCRTVSETLSVPTGELSDD